MHGKIAKLGECLVSAAKIRYDIASTRKIAMFGLILAAVMSVFSVFTDIARKKVLDRQYDVALVSFWCKFVALFAYAAGIVGLALYGTAVELPDIGSRLGVSPQVAFVLYLTLNTFLEGTAILLSLRALQVSPISLCMPFMAATPLFLLPAGKFLLHESITSGMVIGVCLVVVGSLIVNRQLFAQGLLEPAKAIIRERGSRYMLLVALLLTFTNVLDKWFATSGGQVTLSVQISRSFVLAIGKCIMLAIFFACLTVLRLGKWKAYRKNPAGPIRAIAAIPWRPVWRDVPVWVISAGVLEAVVLVLQLTAVPFTALALVISIKRCGIVLAVFLGWLVFKERGITDRVIASCVMLSGVLIFTLTKPDAAGTTFIGCAGALAIALASLVGMSVALYLTRNHYA